MSCGAWSEVRPAPSSRILKRRVDDYLWREGGAPIQRLRDILGEHFRPLGPSAVIGGLVRDMARRGKVGFMSDIDLVIDAPPREVAELAGRLGAAPNAFGGYSSSHPGWEIDFWALTETWAAVAGHVRMRGFDDLVDATFFDCDAICYEIETRRLHALPGYFERLASRKIEVNLLPNPSPEGNLLRAARRILLWGFDPGPRLRAFLEATLDEDAYRLIVSRELSLYANDVLGSFGSADALLSTLLRGGRASPFVPSDDQPVIPGLEA